MITLVSLFSLLLAISLLVVAAMLLLSVLGGAQLVTTPKVVWPLIVKLAGLKSGEQWMELGSGLGYVSGFVGRSTKARVVGIDLALLWVWLARILQQGSSAEFRVGNLFTADLTQVDVVYCYLLPPMLTKLELKFVAQLRPSSRVITYGFPLPNRDATRSIKRTKDHGPLFLYEY